MSMLNKNLILLLNDKIILNYIKNKCITFKNAQKVIILSTENNNIVNIIFDMIKCENAYDIFYQKINYGPTLIKPCCINSKHKCKISQICYYKMIDCSSQYCNNCVDMMVRFSEKMKNKICKFYYKKLKKLYLLLIKTSIYLTLDIDCFNTIIKKYLKIL